MIKILLGILASVLVSAALKPKIEDGLTVINDDFTRWDILLKKYSKLTGVPWRWGKAIMWVESDLGRHKTVVAGMRNPLDLVASVSTDKKSYGLMQVTPDTANRPRVRPGTTPTQLNNPEINIECGMKVLGELKTHYFPGSREFIIRAYNGGPGFQGTLLGKRDTPIYYEKFKGKLSLIMAKQPGNEMEIG